MTLNNFIPSVWSARLLVNLRKSLVYSQTGVINTEYEGEIKGVGDSVRINSIGPVTISDYVKNGLVADPEVLTDAQLIMVIDQAKAFNFFVDDIDKVQQQPKVMDAAMKEAAYGLKDKADKYTAGIMAAGAAADNYIGSDSSPKTDLGTAANAYQYLVDLGVKLDEADVPTDERFVVVPPWFHGVLQKDDRFVKAGNSASDERLKRGLVGEAAGFEIWKSNNVPNISNTKFKIIAGYPGATAWVEQINKTETYRPERRFADAVKGLYLYGAKVIRARALAVLVANRPA